MGSNNPKELDRGPAGGRRAGGTDGDPGNRIGSALATEMVIALLMGINNPKEKGLQNIIFSGH